MLTLSLDLLSYPQLPLLFTGLSLFIARVVYNLHLHPLAHIPGPFWARASGIPSWLYARGGKRHLWIWQQFEIYGSPIRIKPNTVLFCDPGAYAEIYGTKANVRRSDFYLALQRKHDEKGTMTTLDPVEHAKRRKHLNIAFSEGLIREATSYVIKHVNRWNELLVRDIEPGQWTAPVMLSDSFGALMFDIMGDLTLGKSFDIKEPGENNLKRYPNIISDLLRHLYSISSSPLLNTILWLKPRGLDALLEKVAPDAVKAYQHFVEESVGERFALQKEQAQKQEHEKRKDIFYFVHNAKDPDTGLSAFTDKQVQDELSFLIIGGSDTTAICLSAIFFYLTGEPMCLQKLVDEILTTFPMVEDIVRGPELAGCEYLRACIDEGMRLMPTSPSELPRVVLPGGIYIRGQFYPEGTIVGTADWADSFNEQVYHGDAQVFRPERWIIDDSAGVTKEQVAYIRANCHPFGAGPGKCIASGLAMSELTIIIARTLHRLEVRRARGSTVGGGHNSMGWGACNPAVMQVEDAFLSLIQGPEVQFRMRKV